MLRFEIGMSKLKLCPVKRTKVPDFGNAQGYSLWFGQIDLSQIFDLNTPPDRPCQELLNEYFSFEIGNCILKLWPLKHSQ